jgi:hypothetical protein
MNTFSKLLIVVAAAVTFGAINSAFALSHLPSCVEQSDGSYIAYDNSSDDGYHSPHAADRHAFERGHGELAFGGHDRRR